MKNIFLTFKLCIILFLISCTSSKLSKTPQSAAAITKVPLSATASAITQTTPNASAVTASSGINPEAFTFMSLGSSPVEAANFVSTVKQIASTHSNLIIFNGDLGINQGGKVEINPMVINLNEAGLFDKTFFVRGNHGNEASWNSPLWDSFLSVYPDAKILSAGVTEYVSLNSNSEYPNYSFIYGNSMFIGLDVPGAADILTTEQLAFLDSRLTYAENKGLVHAFIIFQGPLYCIESTNCDCTTRPDASCTPSELASILNRHPIVSASFHGHEHILVWTHTDKNNNKELIPGYEGLLTPPPEGSSYDGYINLSRTNYIYVDVGSSQGFSALSIDGSSFAINFYKAGSTVPVWTKTYTKGAPNAPDTAGSVRPLKYYVVDRVRKKADFATLAAWGINTAIISFDINGKATDWQNVFVEAAKYDINIVIWPSDWKDPRPNCDWEAPYPISPNGDITKVKPLLDVASQHPNFIGIVNGHEYFWTCTNMTFDEMAGLKDQLTTYALSKGRSIKIWNYSDSLFDESRLPSSQIARIMDVAVIWKHCAGDKTDRCSGKKSTLTRIKNSRARLTQLGLGGKVELVFIIQTFLSDSPYDGKFSLPQLEGFSCEILHSSLVDGFGYYTWDAGWWSDLHDWPDLQPAILFTHDNCFHADP